MVYVTDRTADVKAGGGYGSHWAAQPSCGVAEAYLPAAPPAGETVWGYVEKTAPTACATAQGRLGGAVAAILTQTQAKGCRSVFVFVHGFHTGFDGAVLRAAQIAHDAQTACAVAAFSWTSEGKLDRYTVDQERSFYAQPLLAEFLHELADAGLRVDLMGHSMGGRMAAATLAGMAQARARPPENFIDEMILAAADIGVEPGDDDFAQLLRAAVVFVKRTTVYASNGDAVLQASSSAHGGVTRLGAEPIADLAYRSDGAHVVDVIDASPVPADALGHSYYAMSYEALYDLTMVLKGVATADRLKPVGPWPATLVEGDGGLRLTTERRPRLITRLMVRLVP